MEIGERLKEERTRLGMSQTELAELGCVQRNTLFNYEKGVRSPDADFLARIAERGADILYIVTGRRSGALLGVEQESQLAALSRLPQAVREWLLGVTGVTNPQPVSGVSYGVSEASSRQLHQEIATYGAGKVHDKETGQD
ncbi:helix-turn-helix domain-containing protein [Uliginosibacterium gangwonense]|uniref:helix-turn-helix domain-containing protein n=1 Tax=Uliginosibacterium gangwonense TaxID=392736 RepID=UPI00038086C6|nr:helix-turn-helix transcriptional regulator [Uliginosibacterium gangwonense]